VVLVVDDDGDWRALMADSLADEGFEVVTVPDGRAACDCFRRVRPAVVVTDVEMPSMDGSELLAQLRSLDRDLPVIVITAEDVQHAPAFAEAFSVIPKPATTDAVTAAVKEALLRRPRTRLRQFWSAARAGAVVVRERGYGIAVRAVNRCWRPAKGAAIRPVRRDTRQGAGGLGRLAVIAGIGVATAAAILIAALRGPAV
jgi:DNA-binding NtrC family response regulator